ncbi:serine/threonine-protein kinase 35-like [Branchiostoma lanceolatum]|uniref:serine/threonine-protein kinase 35-like n=1 Tax=Branchiostoma lanceolatum TaxID=7740 RepID=UPI00345591F4
MNEAVGELNTLTNLPRHDHIAQLIGHEIVYSPSAYIWIFLEFCEGGTLGDYVFRNQRNVTVKRQLTFQLADAVTFLHRLHIVHRDLKPQNLMIKDKSEFPILKVVDFGMATVSDRLDQDKVHKYFTGSLGGTPFYIAPEAHLSGAEQNTGRTWTTAVDIFSMGLIIWAMFDNLNSSNADQEPYLAPCVRNSKGHPEPIGHLLARGRRIDHTAVMKSESKRRNLVLTMIDPDYKKRPSADEVFNNLKLVDDQSDQNAFDILLTGMFNRGPSSTMNRSTATASAAGSRPRKRRLGEASDSSPGTMQKKARDL